IKFDEAPAQDVLRYLGDRSSDLDLTDGRGLKFVAADPQAVSALHNTLVTVELSDAKLGEVLHMVCAAARPPLDYRVEGDRVLVFRRVVRPAAEAEPPAEAPKEDPQVVAARQAAALLKALPAGTE